MTLVDPRTQLTILATIPRRLANFTALDNAIVHWIGPVNKCGATTRESTRVAILGDVALYVCDDDGTVRRCIAFAELKDLVVRDDRVDDAIGFRTAVKGEYDLLLKFGKDRDVVMSTVAKIYFTHMGKELHVVKLGAADPIQPHMQLSRPAHWTLRVEPLRPKSFLDKLVLDHTVTTNRSLERVQEEFMRLKNELRFELESMRNDQYDRMVSQTAVYAAELTRKDDVINHLLDHLDAVRPFVLDTKAANGVGAVLRAVGRMDVPPPTTAGGAAATAGKPSFTGASPPMSSLVKAVDTMPCGQCQDLRNLLESHPSTDKRRILAAEEALQAATRQLERLRRTSAPDKEEIVLLRKALRATDECLRDQRKPLQERVRAALQISSPYVPPVKAIGTSNSGGATDARQAGSEAGLPSMSSDPRADVNALIAEVLTLRGVIRDASALHMGELARIRGEFQSYDSYMVHAVRERLEELASTAGQAKSLATRLVDDSRLHVPVSRLFTHSPSQQRGETSPRSSPDRHAASATASPRRMQASEITRPSVTPTVGSLVAASQSSSRFPPANEFVSATPQRSSFLKMPVAQSATTTVVPSIRWTPR